VSTKWERVKEIASASRHCEQCGAPLVREQHGKWHESIEHFAGRKFCNLQCRSNARDARLGLEPLTKRQGYELDKDDVECREAWKPSAAPALAPDDWRLAVYGGTTITGAVHHRSPRKAIRLALERQGNVCLYCQIPIGTEILRQHRGRSKVLRLRRNFDHFVPHSYVARNPGSNFVIACYVCNTVKRGNMFATVEEARAYVIPKREQLGYEPAWSVLRRVNLGGAKAAAVPGGASHA
jgi:hypothetical protein